MPSNMVENHSQCEDKGHTTDRLDDPTQYREDNYNAMEKVQKVDGRKNGPKGKLKTKRVVKTCMGIC